MTDRRVATEEDVQAAAFYWVENDGTYRVILLREQAKPSKGESVSDFKARKCFELSGDTPELLSQKLEELGWDPPPVEDLRRLCESAPRSRMPAANRKWGRR